jgi:tetratricopeptide (TPR) repeat protein
VQVQLGKVDSAEEHALRALEIRRARLGDHRDTATSLTVLGKIARRRQDVAAAVAYNEEALAMRRRIFDADSPAIGDSLKRLGVLQRDAGNLEASEKLLREALANWTSILGETHPDVGGLCLDLAHTLRQARKYDEAAALCIAARDKFAAKFGPTSSRIREARDVLIGVRLEVEDWTGAQALIEEGLAVERAAHPEGSLLQIYLAAQLGATLITQGRTQEAEELLLAGWKAMESRTDLFPENKLLVLDSLVRLYVTLGDEESAERYRVLAAGLRGPFDSR